MQLLHFSQMSFFENPAPAVPQSASGRWFDLTDRSRAQGRTGGVA